MDAPFIESIHFRNFKALRDTTLPLGRFTLLVGPNGCGKSTVLRALRMTELRLDGPGWLTAGEALTEETMIAVRATWGRTRPGLSTEVRRTKEQGTKMVHLDKEGRVLNPRDDTARTEKQLARVRVYSLDAERIAASVPVQPELSLDEHGGGLSGVLDRLRDDYPERFDMLQEAFQACVPEFDRILFETPAQGQKAIKLRTRKGQHPIPARDLSQGTLLALCILTLAYLPEAPPLIGLEEPDRGIHPRLFRDVRDAIYRLAYPESCGENRDPVQVVATTHSPYLLDLFRDHPEEIVIANKVEGNVEFKRLSDLPNINEILEDAVLGDVWYSGILGGVPANR